MGYLSLYDSITQLFGVRQKGIAPHSETCWYNFSKESQQVGVTAQQSRVCALFEGTQRLFGPKILARFSAAYHEIQLKCLLSADFDLYLFPD